MYTTFLVSFREYLEILLIVGIFFGINKKLNLRKGRQMTFVTVGGICISFILPILVFIFSAQAKNVLTEKNAELLEGYLTVFAGIFLGYVTISLHRLYQKARGKELIDMHMKMQDRSFDFSLYSMLFFLVIREGFEIALFTTATSLLNTFTQNMIGLFGGFICASIIGILATVVYMQFPLQQLFKATEYAIILLGAAMTKNGMVEIFEYTVGVHLSRVGPIPLTFLPATQTLMGSVLKNMTGIEPKFSIAKALILLIYVLVIAYVLHSHNHAYSPKKAQALRS